MSTNKVKSRPEDFEVEELTEFAPASGPFALYRLTKRGIGTFEAVQAMARRWKVPRQAISFGGLKDRHAVTHQWLTIHRGPRRDLKQESFSLTYHGQASRPFESADITANRFRIVLRDMSADSISGITGAADRVRQLGVPNYFDDQRFGSLGESGEFIAKPWCLGDYERAVWLAIADRNVHDRPRVREEKDLLQRHWGDWNLLAGKLSDSSHRDLFRHLAEHPTDFRRAITFLPTDLRSLYLAAFQSAIWNDILAEWLREHLPPECLKTLTVGHQSLLTWGEIPPSLAARTDGLALPLPSARLHLEPGPLLDLYERAISRHGLALRELRVKYPRDSFFSKGDRTAVVVPRDLGVTFAESATATLDFILPRGAYATMVVKSLLGAG
jgi:tRNA pseudouridine13 synthase